MSRCSSLIFTCCVVSLSVMCLRNGFDFDCFVAGNASKSDGQEDEKGSDLSEMVVICPL